MAFRSLQLKGVGPIPHRHFAARVLVIQNRWKGKPAFLSRTLEVVEGTEILVRGLRHGPRQRSIRCGPLDDRLTDGAVGGGQRVGARSGQDARTPWWRWMRRGSGRRELAVVEGDRVGALADLLLPPNPGTIGPVDRGQSFGVRIRGIAT